MERDESKNLRLVGHGRPLTDLLEAARRAKGWSYQRIADEITRINPDEKRTVDAVRQMIQGETSGRRFWAGKTPLAPLVARVLGVPDDQLESAMIADAYVRQREQNRRILGRTSERGFSHPSAGTEHPARAGRAASA